MVKFGLSTPTLNLLLALFKFPAVNPQRAAAFVNSRGLSQPHRPLL